MSNTKIPTFIITKYSADDFTKWISETPDFIVNANIIVIHEVSAFKMIYGLFNQGAKYRLLIHPQMNNSNDNVNGVTTLNALRWLNVANEIPFITRNSNIRNECRNKNVNSITKDDYIYFDATRCDAESFINDIPIFTKNENKIIPKINQQTQNNKIDFTILTALPKEEFSVFKSHLRKENDNGFFVGKFKELKEGHYNKSLALVSQINMGMVDSAIVTTEIVNNIQSDMIILSGVCGGRKGKIKLYDIIIPENILDIVTGKYENGVFVPYNYTEKINKELIKYLKEELVIEDFIKTEMLNLIPNSPKYKREKEIALNIEIHFDTMACGPFVLKTKDFLEKKSKEINDKIVGFEMESYGLIRALELSKFNKYGLVIKSVMDYTDAKKSDVKNDNSSDEEDIDKIPMDEDIKNKAAYMSYICTRALLPHLEKFLINNRK